MLEQRFEAGRVIGCGRFGDGLRLSAEIVCGDAADTEHENRAGRSHDKDIFGERRFHAEVLRKGNQAVMRCNHSLKCRAVDVGASIIQPVGAAMTSVLT